MKAILVVVTALIFSVAAYGQDEPTGKTLASTIDVYVFPTEGQESDQQSMDEVECYDWAVANSGGDPFDLAAQEQRNEQQAQAEMDAAQSTGQGAGARGVARGAAAGAIIGEVTGGDAGESAAIGAAVVGVRGRRQGRQARGAAEQQAAQQAQARQEATAEDLENFKKAFGVCLEAKDYMVKY